MGLLLLRIAVGVRSMIHGGVYLSNHTHPVILEWAAGLVVAAAVFVLIGLLTPVMGTITGLGVVGTSLARLLDSNSPEILLLTMAAAIVFLGPGAFSLDARLFGRREIIIPATSRPSKVAAVNNTSYPVEYPQKGESL
ncbi:MAG: hypothetical protein JO108_36485 [Acidobacteriaceae bacterium]|nr:hypothetical protein [Acidobacteriaceae bacterium]